MALAALPGLVNTGVTTPDVRSRGLYPRPERVTAGLAPALLARALAALGPGRLIYADRV